MVRSCCQHWQVKDQIKSPSFNLLNIYNGQYKKDHLYVDLAIYHLDLYRLSYCSNREVEELHELYDNRDFIFLIEWPTIHQIDWGYIAQGKNASLKNIHIHLDKKKDYRIIMWE